MKTDYSKGLINQIEDMTVQNERLTAENKRLREENGVLRARISYLESTMTARIETAVASAVEKATAPLFVELAIKEATIAKMGMEIDRLKAQLGKNSNNSSKPPSQDGFTKIPNLREKSTRKRGGQIGHPGACIKLPDNLDKLIEKGLARRETIDYTNGTEPYTSRYTVDLNVTVVVTEHRYPKGQVPLERRTPIVYGDNLKTLVNLLSVEGFIAEERLSNFINEISYGAITLSDATIEHFMTEFANQLDRECEVIKTDLLNGSILHVDETGMDVTQKPDYSSNEAVMRESKQSSFTAYIRTHSNERSTLYTVNPQKDAEGCERDGILPQYIGIMSHDHETKFYKYGTAHATCGAHLLRDLKGLFELQKIPWANEMKKLIASMNEHKNNDLIVDKTQCDEEALKSFEKQYDDLLESGRIALAALKKNELGQIELRRMITRLAEYKDCYFLFIRDYRAPFTNNLAERDLRPNKTKQKVSGCFRSWDGIQRFAKIRSFISTVKKRSGNLFDSISLVLKSLPFLNT